MLPTTGITTTIVGNALGISSRDTGVLCTSDKINIWSKYKPIDINSPTITQLQRDTTTGFYQEDFISGIFTIKLFKPQKVTSCFRLGDFRGYNHYAKPLIAEVEKTDYIGAPSGTDCYITSGSIGKFNVNVTLPDIYIHDIITGSSNGIIQIVSLYNNEKVQIGALNLLNVSRELYYAEYANKTKKIECTIDVPYMSAGDFTKMIYYITVNDGMFISMLYSSIPVNVYKRFEQDPSDPSQWLPAQVIIDLSGSGSPEQNPTDYIKYTSFKYIMRKNEQDRYMVEFLNLWSGLTGFKTTISYMDDYTGKYVEFLQLPPYGLIDDFTLWNLEGGAIYYSNKLFITNHDFDFNGINKTVKCANATVLFPVTANVGNKIKISYTSR